MAKLNAALCLDTKAKKWNEWKSNPQPPHHIVSTITGAPAPRLPLWPVRNLTELLVCHLNYWTISKALVTLYKHLALCWSLRFNRGNGSIGVCVCLWGVIVGLRDYWRGDKKNCLRISIISRDSDSYEINMNIKRPSWRRGAGMWL